MSRRCASIMCVVLVCVVTFHWDLGTASAADQKLPRYEKADCPMDIPPGRKVECGYLTVPEDRANPSNGRTVKIAAAVFKSDSSNPQPDPTVYLEGGPGGRTLADSNDYVNGDFAPFLEKRDLILFDQRGTGFSTPSLACPETTEQAWADIDKNLTIKQQQDSSTQALQACHDRLVKEGVNLSAYTSAENAADVSDLRVALGYKSWNLYGISYGTRLGLTVMRDHPQGIRSAILDSNIPPEIDANLTVPQTADRVFKTLFNGCAKNTACNAAYPNLEKVFYDTVARLNANPVQYRVTRDSNKKRYTMLFKGDDLISELFSAFYVTSILGDLPSAIYAAQSGKFDLFVNLKLLDLSEYDTINEGLYYSIDCTEEVSFDSPAALQNADKNFPQENHVFDASDVIAKCKGWNVKPAPAIENKPVTSDLPALVTEGEYDPITPPSFGVETAKTLKNSFYFEFPGMGHGATIGDLCPTKVALDFLDNPTVKPDATCIAGMHLPKFTIGAPDDPNSQPPAPNAPVDNTGNGGST